MPRFVGPFEILERIGPIAYHLALSPNLSCIHDVFHVFVLRLYHLDMSHVLDWHTLQEEDEQLSLDLVRILQHQGLILRGQFMEQVRVQWDPSDDSSVTWEDVACMR